MLRKNAKSGVVEATPGYLEALITDDRPHSEKNLKLLLLPYLTFRLYVKFPKPHPGTYPNPTRTFYSNEFRETYKQCLHHKVDCIRLNKYQGYYALIKYVEHGIKGKYLSAKIYMRDAETNRFDILCREYYKGGLDTDKQNDPLLSEDEVEFIYYQIIDGKLLLTKTKPAEVNFSEEVSKALNI